MKENITIRFQDADTEEESLVIVRDDGKNIGLCLSILSNGDIEVFMDKKDVVKLIEALNTAVQSCGG
jgi:hypothetical protein